MSRHFHMPFSTETVRMYVHSVVKIALEQMLKLASIRLFEWYRVFQIFMFFLKKRRMLWKKKRKNKLKIFYVHTQNMYWSVFSVHAHINLHTHNSYSRGWSSLFFVFSVVGMGNPWFDATFINYTWFGIVSVFITPHRHAISTNPLRLHIQMF